MKNWFDSTSYLDHQSKHILERVKEYDKLYLEFGGKLFNDLHAKRVLPGFDPNAKIKVLHQLKDSIEVIICIYAGDIEKNKVRADLGITYDQEIFKLIDDLRIHELPINSVVITRYQPSSHLSHFITKLERRNIKVYTHSSIPNYPTAIETIVSPEGYGKNPYIPTSKPIILVTGAGAGSGKLATCLNQLYHEHQSGNHAGYAKFETFPVRNLPLQHPLNIAYEAATIDLHDINMIDPFHLQHYGKIAINYNRDIESFPLLQKMFQKISNNRLPYHSPTDMWVNQITSGITNHEIIEEAAKQEVISRVLKAQCQYKKGNLEASILQNAERLLQKLNLNIEDRPSVIPARAKLTQLLEENKKIDEQSVVAFMLNDSTIITGKKSWLMDAPAAALLNTLKYLSNCDDNIHLLAPAILTPIITLKQQILKTKKIPLETEEILIALSISAATNPLAQQALLQLPKLDGIQAHSTHILSIQEEQTITKLGINITCDPLFPNENLYYSS